MRISISGAKNHLCLSLRFFTQCSFVKGAWLPYFVNAREKTRKELFYIGMFCQKLSGTHINGLCFCALLSGRHYPRHFFVNIDREAFFDGFHPLLISDEGLVTLFCECLREGQKRTVLHLNVWSKVLWHPQQWAVLLCATVRQTLPKALFCKYWQGSLLLENRV